MIISHQHRYIFFAVPKTATHAIREALRLSKADDDWEQQTLFGQQSIPIEAISKIQHGHITARELEPELDMQQWRSYTKFAFVRNPYERFVSICFFLNRSNPHFERHSSMWMKDALKREKFRNRVLVRPQIEQLVDKDRRLAMDFIGRYETLQSSLNELFEALGLEHVDLKIINSSKHQGYKRYYDDELIKLVGEFYSEDLSAFGYFF